MKILDYLNESQSRIQSQYLGVIWNKRKLSPHSGYVTGAFKMKRSNIIPNLLDVRYVKFVFPKVKEWIPKNNGGQELEIVY